MFDNTEEGGVNEWDKNLDERLLAVLKQPPYQFKPIFSNVIDHSDNDQYRLQLKFGDALKIAQTTFRDAERVFRRNPTNDEAHKAMINAKSDLDVLCRVRDLLCQQYRKLIKVRIYT